MYNKITLMGRIVNDLELKTTPQGVPVLSFRMAVDRAYTPKGEEKKSDFFNIVCWRGNAEFVSKFFGKGRMILIEGELQTRPYTDKNGNQATWYEIIADRTCFTGEAKQNGQASSPAHTAPNAPDSLDDDNYPFF